MSRSAIHGERPPLKIFLATTMVLFSLSLSAADSVGFVPCYVDGTECTSSLSPTFVVGREVVALSELPQLSLSEAGQAEDLPLVVSGVEPEQIVIPEIDLDLPVQNIESRDVAVLDEHLKDGPVRYVDSARLGEEGNVLIFAHTSHLPVVKNQMYKAFNRVPELGPGDAIRISGGGREYLYNVVSVEQMDIEDPTSTISLAKEGKRLTLVTCDTLTGKSARYILEAQYVATL